MERTQTSRPGAEGRLPAMAPLANPYVPFQLEQPPKYEARKALIRGTLFPGLDLPFRGMVNETEKPDTQLSQLQALGFAIAELALYLDTHRTDEEALKLYREYQQLYRAGAEAYTETLGQALALRRPPEAPCLCLDRIRLTEGSYLDVGAPVGPALPVVVKTLILSNEEGCYEA